MRAMLGLLIVPAAGILAGVRAVRAADEDMRESVRLEYESGGGCPDRASFEARVRARTARALFVTSGSAARTFQVDLAPSPSPHGRFTVRRARVVEGTREVRADTCADVADALALAAALAVDPASFLVAPPTVASPPAPPLPPLGVSASPASSAPPPPPPLAATPAGPARDAVPSRAASLPHTLSFGADLAMAMGVSPQTLVGVSPRLGWRAPSASLFAPAVSVAFLRAESGTLGTPAGAATFAWTVGRVDGCAVSWPPGAARLLGCVRIEGGALQASGLGVLAARTPTRAWFAVGPLVRGEWALLPPLFVAADVAAMVHVTADRFFFLPDATIYEVPLVGLEAAGGLGVHFL